MDENAKEYLYKQLEQIVQYSVKEDKEELISKEKFMEMTGAECLKYVFEYRDNNEPYEFNGEKGNAYIQLPNMDLSNENLEDIVLRYFILGHTEDNEKVVSSINFANTGIILDLNTILENQVEKNGKPSKKIIDFSQCNFDGCTMYGILPDEYQDEKKQKGDKYEIRGRENLGEEYIERREELHDEQAPGELARKAYERLRDGKDWSRLNGIAYAEEIHLEDFDFNNWNLLSMYETFDSQIDKRPDLYKICLNIPITKSRFNEVSDKKEILYYALRYGWGESDIEKILRENPQSIKFKKHIEKGKGYEEHPMLYYAKDRNIEMVELLLRNGASINESSYISYFKPEKGRFGYHMTRWGSEEVALDAEIIVQLMMKEIADGNFKEFERSFEASKIYYKLAEKRGEILIELVKQGKEIKFVENEFSKIDDYEQKRIILEEMAKQGKETEFVFLNARYIKDEEIREKLKKEMQKKGISDTGIECMLDPSSNNLIKLLDEDISLAKRMVKEVSEDKNFSISGFEKGVSKRILDYLNGKKEKITGALIDLAGMEYEEVLEELLRQKRSEDILYLLDNGFIDYIEMRNVIYPAMGDCIMKALLSSNKEYPEAICYMNTDEMIEYIDYMDKRGRLYRLEEEVDTLNYDATERWEYAQNRRIQERFDNSLKIWKEEKKREKIKEAQEKGISKGKAEYQIEPNGKNLSQIISEDIEFVKKQFYELDDDNDKSEVLKEIVKQEEDQEFVDKNWNFIIGKEEIEINSNQFRNIVGCGEKETQELIKLIERSQISLTDLIRKKAILASCGIDIKDALTNHTIMISSPDVLYAKKKFYESIGEQASISNLGVARKKFEKINNKSLFDICKEYRFLDFSGKVKDTVVEEINKEIQEQKEKKAERTERLQNQQQSRIEAKSNLKAHKVNPVVSTFLQTQVGITEKQEQKLGEWLQRFNYDIYSQNIEEDLVLKKQIFDQFGVTSQAFGMSCKILTIPLKTLYARAQFLKDIGEKVTPANLMATLGANGDIFAQKYGSYFMEEKSEQDAQYIMNVESATNENYPMPNTKEEIMRKIKEMEEEQK